MTTRPTAGDFLFRTKVEARKVLEARRRSFRAEEVVEKGREAQSHLASLSFFRHARVVALYAAQPFEVPTTALAAQVRERGGVVCYPCATKQPGPMHFRSVKSEQELTPQAFQILAPAETAPLVPLEAIEVMVVPGVGFTRDGDRLGRGGGHYDMTLSTSQFRGISVGLTFADCIVDALPQKPHDCRVKWVVSEREAIAA